RRSSRPSTALLPWSPSTGTGGRHRSEMVVAINRIHWSPCPGARSLRDQSARDGDDGFLDELLKPAQSTERSAGVDGADSTRMACAPGFEQIQSLSAAYLSDRDAVRSQTK